MNQLPTKEEIEDELDKANKKVLDISGKRVYDPFEFGHAEGVMEALFWVTRGKDYPIEWE